MKVSVVIPHYFTVRNSNLPVLVDALQSGTRPPDEIVIWNNDAPLPFTLPGVRVMQSPWNLHCKARFIAAIAAVGDVLVFQDNDVSARPGTLAQLLKWHREMPEAILSMDGRRVRHGEAYSEAERVRSVKLTAPERIEITLGRMELMSRETMMRVLARFPWRDDTIMDDLAFSYAAAEDGVPCYVVPCGRDQDVTKLNTHGVGLSVTHKEAYFAERDRVCQALRERQEAACSGTNV